MLKPRRELGSHDTASSCQHLGSQFGRAPGAARMPSASFSDWPRGRLTSLIPGISSFMSLRGLCPTAEHGSTPGCGARCRPGLGGCSAPPRCPCSHCSSSEAAFGGEGTGVCLGVHPRVSFQPSGSSPVAEHLVACSWRGAQPDPCAMQHPGAICPLLWQCLQRCTNRHTATSPRGVAGRSLLQCCRKSPAQPAGRRGPGGDPCGN